MIFCSQCDKLMEPTVTGSLNWYETDDGVVTCQGCYFSQNLKQLKINPTAMEGLEE